MVVVWLLLAAGAANAQKSSIFVVDGKAIRGYDPVAYFTEGKALPGTKKFVYQWAGADWYFSSAENLGAFRQNPDKYLPQYGGYCAYGMANGYKAPTEVDAWTILDGKLYLNYNKKVRGMWQEKQKEYITAANKNWPKTKDKG